MTKLSLEKALRKAVPHIEKLLYAEICGIARVTKVYGSNANSFIITAIDSENNKKNYFLKFMYSRELSNELHGAQELSNYIPSPGVILYSNSYFHDRLRWILYESIEGTLMSEIAYTNRYSNDTDDILKHEEQKENILEKMYKKTRKTITYNQFLKENTNKLFIKRLQGSRYKKYYQHSPDNISKNFDYRITLNGTKFDSTISDIVNRIQQKYSNIDNSQKITTYLGHGDAHQGNIIINGENVFFIDFEYYGQISAFMEIAKPYYNDFMGFLFLTHRHAIDGYFKIVSVDSRNNNLDIKIKPERSLKLGIELTKIKLRKRGKVLKNPRYKDILSINDYLIMCHMLTKNPNLYPKKNQHLFLAFCQILANFDPFEPESIYDYF